MKAIKGNKVYIVTETTKGPYLAQGYDIADDKGNIIERPPQSTVKYSEYAAVLEENKSLKAEIKKLKKGEA